MESKNTLWITVDSIKISFFVLKKSLIEPPIHTEYLEIASIQDIAAMKLWAIQNRATNKDYIDLALIIEKIWLKQILQSFFRKYGNVVSDNQLLKSLVYFDDVIDEPLKIKKNHKEWEESKEYLIKTVRSFLQ